MEERRRLEEDARRERNWKRWGPYLAERQWGTVREDYSADGEAWSYFPFEHSRSRAYRWGEDGLLGITDRQGRLCFALALWNGRDPILKERLFGLTGPQGNHGEDVKERYYYLDATPTHSYMRALYKYPQAEFPYARLVLENGARGRHDPELELEDTGVFDESRYFDITAEYAKAGPDDILVRVTVANRGPEPAPLHLLPTLWFRNTWSWGCRHEGCGEKPSLRLDGEGEVLAVHETLGRRRWSAGAGPDGRLPLLLFTENETNSERIFGTPNERPHVKDAFHDYVIDGQGAAVSPALRGTKVAAHYRFALAPGEERSVELRLREAAGEGDGAGSGGAPFGEGFDATFRTRRREADAFFDSIRPVGLDDEQARVWRQGYAGLLWTKQFYHYVVADWLEGDLHQPPPPESRLSGRNREWRHLYSRDLLSMPDKWEYPWFAAWDTAFHMIPFARLDPAFARDQLLLFLREWYMHPNGQIPAYEYNFSDVNPPVHAWAAWRVYKMTGRDRTFLSRVFQKLLLNFTWWVNRKDPDGRNVFAGGFLGMDNVGVFDRSRPLPTGGHLEQADGTAWMAFFAATMLSIALELAQDDPAAEDMASKFFEHFVSIADATNRLGGTGLWDEEDGFYYDHLRVDGEQVPLKVRSLVGAVPLIAVEVIGRDVIERLPEFAKRSRWFLDNRRDLAEQISYMRGSQVEGWRKVLLAIPSRERLLRVLRYLLDEEEFLSPYGLRSLSKVHRERPYMFHVGDEEYRVDYVPGESDSGMFGGNSNWRGPVWFPLNFLLVEALERYHFFFGDELQVECPTGSGRMMNLGQVAREIATRLVRIFLPGENGQRPCHGDRREYADDPHHRELLLFHEYFHGEDGRGLGASHQTGWTALVVRLIEKLA
jgi:hypothetical protein